MVPINHILSDQLREGLAKDFTIQLAGPGVHLEPAQGAGVNSPTLGELHRANFNVHQLMLADRKYSLS